MPDILTPNQAADFLLAESGEQGHVLTNLKLQNLLYYAQRWFLTLEDRALFAEDFLAWAHAGLFRVIRNHSCKHLLAIVMEYVHPEWETIEELREIIKDEYERDHFPPRVSSALNILYNEKIRGREFKFKDDRKYEPEVVEIAYGERDKVKQNAVYVDLDRSCRVKNTPMNVTREQAKIEYERAGRYASIITQLVGPDAYEGLQLERLREAMKIVFWQEYEPNVS